MSLKKWFISKITVPVIILSIILSLIITASSLFQFYNEVESKKSALSDFIELANLGLLQKNRTLVESALNLAITSLKIEKVLLCENEQIVFSYPDIIDTCHVQTNPFWSLYFIKSPKGRPDIKFYFGIQYLNYFKVIFTLIIILCSLYIIFYFTINKLNSYFEEEILKPLGSLDDASSEITEINTLILKNKELRLLQLNSAVQEAMINLASQVAHDIRSPLTGLNMVISNLNSDIPEEKRILLRSVANRINDIANQLLLKTKSLNEESKNGLKKSWGDEQNLEIELLPAILDSLISEKRVQFHDKVNVSINNHFEDSYGSFAKINSVEFKRVISNLINNSIEAFNNFNGQVDITIEKSKELVILKVKDNGKGIPKSIIDKIGTRGFSYGKTLNQGSGSGLGIYHAKSTIEALGGKFSIISELEKGTEITIELPLCKGPNWFVEKINLINIDKIIIIDDDINIFNTWKQKFLNFYTQNNIPEILYFNNIASFKKWHELNKYHSVSTLLFVDFEFSNNTITGLDLISELHFSKNIYLVTSRFEEQKIRNKCENLKLKLIPKSMVINLPITIEKGES